MRSRDGRVAGLRVRDVPVPGSDLRQQREHGVSQVAVPRHELPGLAGEEPVRLRVVQFAPSHRAAEHVQVVRVHLIVSGHHARDVGALLDRPPVAGHDRRPDTAVALVLQHLDASIRTRGQARALERPILRGVVDDVDAVDEVGNAGQGLREQLGLVVGGHHDRHALALQHRR
jgi:hypothetical protein